MSQTPAISATGVAKRQAARRKPFNTDRVLSILVISPSVILIGIFIYSFLIRTAYVSLVNWNDLKPTWEWRGLVNYVRLFDKQRFQIDLGNTLIFTVAFIIVCVVVGLLLASLLDSRIKGEAVFRAIFMFPLAVSFIVTGVAWRWLESPNSGINLLLGTVGFGWYTDPKIGILGIVVPAVWQISGYVMAMYIAGLRGISEDLREAARVDGATEWDIFRHVLLPLLHPVTLSVVIILGHISLRIFDLVVAMSGSQPGFITDVPALYMWETTFLGSHFSEGAAIAMVMLVLVSMLIVPYLIYNARNEVQQ